METTPLIVKSKKKYCPSFSCLCFMWKKREHSSRIIKLGELPDDNTYPPNYVCNQKYTIITFLPLVLFQQFKFFLNLYFLIMAISQFVPNIRIGYLYTYWGPLCFVLAVTLIREAVDDFRRYRRDKEVNTQLYERHCSAMHRSRKHVLCYNTESVSGSELRVGDVVILHKGQRVPADMILLSTNEKMGTVFIRTDQLDGEIDWKLRVPVPATQRLSSKDSVLHLDATVYAEKPQQYIHEFIGTWTANDEGTSNNLNIENTLWSGCVVESGQATGLVIYTGSETRAVMNNAIPRSKVGTLDLQVNNLTKLLFAVVILLSISMVALKGFSGPWYRFLFRFVLLFSYIIPISLRVNLDMGKIFYSSMIQRDKKISGTVMRSTTIPEELGRVKYILADKTGTLTKNEMVFQKLHLGNELFDRTKFHEVETLLTQHITNASGTASLPTSPDGSVQGNRIDLSSATPRQLWDVVLALALCHNVTPMYDVAPHQDDQDSYVGSDMGGYSVSESAHGAIPQQQLCDYQASSPDEVALVKWTDMMGVSLYKRDLESITLKIRATNQFIQYNIQQIFPFTSESKMMGIIVQEEETNKYTYYVKGADVALCPLLGPPAWLVQESSALASEGLRTLVVAKRTLTEEQFQKFKALNEASTSHYGVGERTNGAMQFLLSELTLLGLTGVEDRLASDVPETLNTLRAAGIKIWMLTGDKLETALCIARSLQLGGSGARWRVADACSRNRLHAHAALQTLTDDLRSGPTALIVQGDTLDMWLNGYEDESVWCLSRCSGVAVARCSPTQKARVVQLLRARGHTVAAVGDGGNDVAMIQEAHIGVGIEGAEGRAAALAGDVAVRQFSALSRLLLVHGRRARMRSAALSLFIIHRGLLISTMQIVEDFTDQMRKIDALLLGGTKKAWIFDNFTTAKLTWPFLIYNIFTTAMSALGAITTTKLKSWAVFSCVFYFSSVSIYPGFLMVGYGTIYTMLPVFSLVLDKDLPSSQLLAFPQHYQDLCKDRELSYKTFFIWTAISIYQGAVIMYGTLVMFGEELLHIVAISYSALILTELVMVALTVVTWHNYMVLAELISIVLYLITLGVFKDFFDAEFITQWEFIWKVLVITFFSCVPLYIVKFTHSVLAARAARIIDKSSRL